MRGPWVGVSSGSQGWLLLRVMTLLAAVRLALWCLPFDWVRRRAPIVRVRSARLASVPVSRLSWAVRVAGRACPGASCLTQALAMQRLLARAGHRSELRLGVALDSGCGLQSHAWVVQDGRVVLGEGADLHRYAPMPVDASASCSRVP